VQHDGFVPSHTGLQTRTYPIHTLKEA
jgi:hypothetical protein